MLGWGQISDAPISDSAPGGTLFTQSCLAQTTPAASMVRQTGKVLRALGAHPTGNYALWSEDLTNAAWATYWAGPTSRTGGQADPFGGTNATQLVLPVSPVGQPPGVFQHPNLTDDPTLPLASGTTGTASAWMKGAVGGEQVTLSIDDQGNGATLSLTTSWVRYPYTHLISHSSSWGGGVIGIKNPSTSTGITIYVYGAMIDPAPYLNAYLMTTTAAVTIGPASLVRAMAKACLAATTPVAALARRLSRAIQASVTPVPTRTSQTGKPLRVATTPPASLVRQTGKLLRATTTPVATLGKAIVRTFQATTTPVASLYRNLARTMQATVTPSARLYLRLVEILRGAFPRSVTLGGDSVASRTTLGGGSDRTTLGGDER